MGGKVRRGMLSFEGCGTLENADGDMVGPVIGAEVGTGSCAKFTSPTLGPTSTGKSLVNALKNSFVEFSQKNMLWPFS